MITLLDNPRVDIEKRVKQLMKREQLIRDIRRSRCKYTCVTSMFKPGLSALRETQKELRLKWKQLKSFDKVPKFNFDNDRPAHQ